MIRSPSTLISNLSPYGNVQSFLSRIGLFPRKVKQKDGPRSIATAVAMVIPAAVRISIPRWFGTSSGCGTIIDPDGTILTCAHVVVKSRGNTFTPKGKVNVTLQDGRTFVGTVVNADLHSDIAIVKINSTLPLPSAKLGSSSKLCLGDWVLALGCPPSFQCFITAGIISCVDCKCNVSGLGGMLGEFVETDCAVIPDCHSGIFWWTPC